MRIAYLSSFYPFRGGIAQFNALLIKEFQKNGHEAKAFTFTTQYPNFLFPGKTQMVGKDDTAEVIDSKRVLNTVNPFSYFTAARIISKFEPDILIMKYWMPFFGPSLGTVAKKLSKKTKSIAILDNVLPHEPRFFDKAFNSYFLKRIDGFIAMSEKVKGDLLKLKPDAKVILLPHPIYEHFGDRIDKQAALQELALKEDKKTLLFFGFIRDYKGLDNLIQAFDKLNKSYQLIIAGETYGSFDKYQELINKNSNRENIYIFNDYIPDNAVSKFFSASDVCILPYKSATQSGITGISYNFGTPILATNKGGLKEFIEHGKTGHIIEDSTPELLQQGIEEFFKAYDAKAMSKNIAKVKEELSWENFAKEVVKFYTEL